MIEALKKLGVPAGVSAIVGAIVAMIPFIFKIDERYAKAEELEKQIKVVSEQIQEINTSVGELAGSQQVLIAVLASSSRVARVERAEEPKPVMSPAPTISIAEPAPLVVTKPMKPGESDPQVALEAVSSMLKRTQQQVQQIRENPGIKQ